MNSSEKDLFKKFLLESQITKIRVIEKLPNISFPYSYEYNQKIHSIIHGRKRSPAPQRIVKAILITALIIILTFTIMACIPSIREFFLEFGEGFIDITPKEPENNTVKHKASIEEYYQLHYLPEGYEQTDYSDIGNNVYTVWENNNLAIAFDQTAPANTLMSIDRDTPYKNDQIGKYSVYYSLENANYFFIWEYDGYIFCFSCPESLDFSEIKKIIKNIDTD